LLPILMACMSLMHMLQAAEPVHFSHLATIPGIEQTGSPVRVHLTSEVIRQTRTGFEDLRLFTGEAEVPYVIYSRNSSQTGPTSFDFAVNDYHEDNGKEFLQLSCERQKKPITRIDIKTSARDFRRHVTIETSENGKTWVKLAEGTIFDFSSKVDLRKCHLTIPESNNRLFRLILDGSVPLSQESTEISLIYKDLKLDIANLAAGQFRYDRISGLAGKRETFSALQDTCIFDAVASLDENGDTVLDLGYVNLPIESLTFSITSPYFHRQLKVLSSDSADGIFRPVAWATIERYPGQQTVPFSVACHLPRQTWVKLVIANDNNPPLTMEQVKVNWARQELIFVPASDEQDYALYFGSDKMEAAQYDLGLLIQNRPDTLGSMPMLEPGAVEANALHDADAPVNSAEAAQRQQQKLFTWAIVVAAVILGVWVVFLTRKLSRQESDPSQ